MSISSKTRTAFVFNHLLIVPFWGLYSMIPFFVLKDLGANSFQIATVVALKPAVSLFTPYWTLAIHQRPSRLLGNLCLANAIRFVPFLFFPLFSSIWYLIFAFGFYMAFTRAMLPTWMETIRRNIDKEETSRTSALGSLIDFSGMIFLPFIFGPLLDNYPNSWKIILAATALIGISSTALLWHLPRPSDSSPPLAQEKVATWLHMPWQKALRLLRERPDFLRFQLGFMLGGAGIMIVQPSLPDYFINTLDLSYTDMLMALSACKGIGFVISSSTWVRNFHRGELFSFTSFVTLFAALFPLGILLAQFHTSFLYIAFLLYGVMQAGSELSWHMSGPLFSQHEDSSLYSSINVLSVGLRGMIIPYLGSFLCVCTFPALPLCLGSLLCLCGTFVFVRFSHSYAQRTL